MAGIMGSVMRPDCYRPPVQRGRVTAPISIQKVTDGTQYTIMLGEAAGRTDGNRFWGDAHQTFVHHNRGAQRARCETAIYSERNEMVQ